MFCVICIDKPQAETVRLENRAAHIAYVLASSCIACAGPFTADDGETMLGTLLIMDVATRREAETWLANDPYYKAGLFAQVDIRAWKHLLGGLPAP